MSGQGRSLDSIVSGIPLAEEPGLGPLTLSAYLREVTRRYSAREAMVLHTPEGAVRWSYAELWERALDVACSLRALGVGLGTRVGVMMTNRPEWIAAVFGVALAGGVAATISTFSTLAELETLLEMSGASVLLFEGKVLKKDFEKILREIVPELDGAKAGDVQSAKYPFLRYVAMLGGSDKGGAIEGWDAFLKRGETQPRALVEATGAAVHPSDPGVLFFSSGTTGKPKGILSAHRGVAIQMWRWRRIYGLDDKDSVRSWTANGFFWSGNFCMAIGGTFSSGGSIVLQQTFNAEEAVELMQIEKVNLPIAWPHQWAQVEAASNWASADLSAMRYADKRSPFARHPTMKVKDWREPTAYGNTETFTISASFPANTPEERVAGAAGEALPGITFKIVDPMTGVIVPRDERGEIAVKGVTLMLGYIGIPLDETLDDEGYFHTGDGGYLDSEGRLYWEGRLSDIIKTGGANVSPVEIDEVLSGIPGVKAAKTVGVPHDTLGEVVVACIVPHEGATLDEESIRNAVKERLASYKAPRHVLFFREEDLSLTGSAKIKSSDVRALAAKRLQAAG